MSLVRAYRNEAFLASPDAREIRILAEYLEPRTRLARVGVDRAIVAFGSARIRPLAEGVEGRDWYREAVEFGELLAHAAVPTPHTPPRWHVLTGGGPGLMQAVNEGVARVDRAVNLGLGISLPFEQQGNPFVDPEQAFEFHYFFMRKFWFVKLAAACVVFPGGFGTFDELFEVLTLTQTGKSAPMPILLYGKAFWEEVINLPALARHGLISVSDLELFKVVDDPASAVAMLLGALDPQPAR